MRVETDLIKEEITNNKNRIMFLESINELLARLLQDEKMIIICSKRMSLTSNQLIDLLKYPNVDINLIKTINYIININNIIDFSPSYLLTYLWQNNITREELMTYLDFKGTKNAFHNMICKDVHFYHLVADASISIYVNKLTNNKGLKYQEKDIEELNDALKDYNSLDDIHKGMICQKLNVTLEELNAKLKARPLNITFYKEFLLVFMGVYSYYYNIPQLFMLFLDKNGIDKITLFNALNISTNEDILILKDDKALFDKAIEVSLNIFRNNYKGKTLSLRKD